MSSAKAAAWQAALRRVNLRNTALQTNVTIATQMGELDKLVTLLRELQERHSLSYIFISHDIALIGSMSHRIMVMKDGKVVEEGSAIHILNTPGEPYTRELIGAAQRKAG